MLRPPRAGCDVSGTEGQDALMSKSSDDKTTVKPGRRGQTRIVTSQRILVDEVISFC